MSDKKIDYSKQVNELGWSPESCSRQQVFVMVKADLFDPLKVFPPEGLMDLAPSNAKTFFKHILIDFLSEIYPQLSDYVNLDCAWDLERGLTVEELEDLYKDTYMKWMQANMDTLDPATLAGRYDWYTSKPSVAMIISLPAPTEEDAVKVVTDIRERFRAYWNDTDSSKTYGANEYAFETINKGEHKPIKYHPDHGSVMNALHVSSLDEAKVFLGNRGVLET